MRFMNRISWVSFLIFWGYVGYRFVVLEHISTGEKLHIVVAIAIMYFITSIVIRMMIKLVKKIGATLSGKVEHSQPKQTKYHKNQNVSVFSDNEFVQDELIKRHPEWFRDTYEGIVFQSQLDGDR